MSKQNVALFVRMVAQRPDLNRAAAKEANTKGWVDLGKKEGLEFGDKDVVGFVGEVTGREVDADNAVSEFTRAMAYEDSADRDAGAKETLNFSARLTESLAVHGYAGIGGDVAQYVEFPLDHVQGSRFDQKAKYRG